jgi:hypothetical protein
MDHILYTLATQQQRELRSAARRASQARRLTRTARRPQRF